MMETGWLHQDVAERLDNHLKRVGIKEVKGPLLLSKALAPTTPVSKDERVSQVDIYDIGLSQAYP